MSQQNKAIDDLKKKMLKAKELNKDIMAYLKELEQKGFEYDRKELLTKEKKLIEGKTLCEQCIEGMMQEGIGNKLPNQSELLERMINYQEQFINGLVILQPHADQVRSLGFDLPKEEAKKNPQQFQTNVVGPKIHEDLMGIDFNMFSTGVNQEQKLDTQEKQDDDMWSQLDNFADFNTHQNQPSSQSPNIHQEDSKES